MTRAPSDDMVDALRRELSDQRYAATTRETQRDIWSQFERFCDRFELTPLDCTENIVLAFMHDHVGLRHSSVRALVTGIEQVLSLQGRAPSDWPRVRRYLAGVRRAGPDRRDRISALSDDEVGMVAAAAVSPALTASRTAFRGLLALARVGAIVSWEGLSATGAQRGSDGQLTYEGRRLAVVDGSLEHQLLVDGGAQPSGACSVRHDAVQLRVTAAAARAGLDVRSPRDVAEASEEDFLTLVVHSDPTHDRRVRNHAYFVLGIHGATRHISLANLLIEDVTETGYGFRVVYRVAKLAAGEVRTVDVLHLEDDPAQCAQDALCPACALARALDVCRRQGRSTGPVLATVYAGGVGVMTRQNGRLVIRALVEAAVPDIHPDRPVGTRTMRCTTTTLLLRAGLTFEETAARTDRSDLSELARYVRLDIEDEVHPQYDFG